MGANLVDVEVIARRLNISEDSVYRYARDGRIPSVRVGSRLVRFDAEAVLQALAGGVQSRSTLPDGTAEAS
jgi:excisionase family DNA binding protein